VKRFRIDLHVHTALSPCASREMTPPAIVAQAVARKLAMIAICDHNTAGNVAAVQRAAEGSLVVLAGMEITTAEEVHVLGIFPDAASAVAAGEVVRSTFPQAQEGWLERCSGQVLMDWNGNVIGSESKILASASALDLSGAVGLIHARGGLAIASHADRPSFSVTSQLGTVPMDAGFDAIELSPFCARPDRFEALGLPIICSSDSHAPQDVGEGCCELKMGEASFRGLALALRAGARGGGGHA
jgi:3',5'-nucleoside bisphosphate phosphatase